MADTHFLPRPETVRRFNRFYIRQIGLLEEGLLRSSCSLTEARVLCKLAHHEEATATHLSRGLDLDAGHLSRTPRNFQNGGLLQKRPADEDRRRRLSSLTESAQDRLVRAMDAIAGLVGAQSERRVPCILWLSPERRHGLGEIHHQGVLYSHEHGRSEEFEALVAEPVADFLRNYDPRWEQRGWIAEREGRTLARSSWCATASGRVSPAGACYLSLGIGSRLVRECTRFARQAGCLTTTLWTNGVLHAARQIYEKEGCRMVGKESSHAFSHDLIEQTKRRCPTPVAHRISALEEAEA